MALFPTTSLLSGGIKTIDISDKPIEAEISRNGTKIPSVLLNQDRVADLVIPDLLDDLTILPRVLYQSIQAGTRVPTGTAVDVVLASPFLVGADLVPGGHRDLSASNMGAVAEIFLPDVETRQAVQLADSYEGLPPAVRSQLETTASDNDVGLVEGTQGRDGQALFLLVQAASTYS